MSSSFGDLWSNRDDSIDLSSCAGCKQKFLPTEGKVSALGKKWHKEHFVCVVCGTSLLNVQYHEHEGAAYCHHDFMETFANRCAGCEEPVFGAHLTALGKHWHADCFVCTKCKAPFDGGRFFNHKDRPYCATHYHDVVGKKCVSCKLVITDNHVSALGGSWHPDCFNCDACGKNLTGAMFAVRGSKPVCKACGQAAARKQSARVTESLNEVRKDTPEPEPESSATPGAATEIRDLGKAYALAVRPLLGAIAASDVNAVKTGIAPAIKPVKNLIAILNDEAKTMGPAPKPLAKTLQSGATATLTQAKEVFGASAAAAPGAFALLRRFLVKLTTDVNTVVSSLAAPHKDPAAPSSAGASTSAAGSESTDAAGSGASAGERQLSAEEVVAQAPSITSMLDQQLRSFLVENAELVIYLTQPGDDDDEVEDDVGGSSSGSGAGDGKAQVLYTRMVRTMGSLAETIKVLDAIDWTGPNRLASDLTSAVSAGRKAVRATPESMASVQRTANELRELVVSMVSPYIEEASGASASSADDQLTVQGPMGLNHRLESFGVGRASRGSHSRFITDWQDDMSKFEPKKDVKHKPRRAQTINVSNLDVDFGSESGLSAIDAITSGTSSPTSPAPGDRKRAAALKRARDRPLPSAAPAAVSLDDVPDATKRNKSGRRRAVSMSLSLLTSARLSASMGSVHETIKPFELALPESVTAAVNTVETQEPSRVLNIQRLIGDLGDILDAKDLTEVAFQVGPDPESPTSAEAGAEPESVSVAVAVATPAAGPESADSVVAREVVLLPRSKRENVEERLVDEDTAASGAACLPAGPLSEAGRVVRSGSISVTGQLELHPPTSGKLTLKRGMFNKWKRRHFLLENGVLYFMKLNGRTVIDRLPVPGCAVDADPESSHDHAFSLTTPEAMGSDVVVFRAVDDEDKARWVVALKDVASMDASLINENLMRPVTKKQSRMTLRKGKSFSLAAGLAAAGIPQPTLVKRKAILEAGKEVLVYINNKVEAGTPDKLISLLVSESDPPPGYESVFLLCYRHALKPKFLLESLMGRFSCVAPPNPTEAQIAYVQTWRPIIQARVLDFMYHWVERNWYDFHDNEVMVVGIMNFVSLVREVGDSDDIRGRADGLDSLIESKITEFDGYQAVVVEPPSNGIAHEWGKLVEYDPVDIARNYTLLEMDKFKAVRPEEFTVQMWGDKSLGFLRVFSENLSAFVDSFNHVSYWVASEICLMPDLKKRVAIVKHIIAIGKEFYDHKNFNGLMAVISGLNLASVQRLKKTWAGIPSKLLNTLHQLETVMAPKSNYSTYRELLRESPAVPFFGLLLKDLTFLDDGNPKRIEGTDLINYDKWRTISRAILQVCSFQDSEFEWAADAASESLRSFLESCMTVADAPLYKYSLLCEPRGASEDSDSQRLIEKWAAAS